MPPPDRLAQLRRQLRRLQTQVQRTQAQIAALEAALMVALEAAPPPVPRAPVPRVSCWAPTMRLATLRALSVRHLDAYDHAHPPDWTLITMIEPTPGGQRPDLTPLTWLRFGRWCVRQGLLSGRALAAAEAELRASWPTDHEGPFPEGNADGEAET